MRYALLATVLALSGCSLYFHGPDGDDAPTVKPDSGPHPIPDAGENRMERCEGGKLYLVDFDDWGNQPGHGQGTQVGACGNGCKTAAVLCDGLSCPTGQALCSAPPSTGKACQLAGTQCSGSGTIDCPQSTTCGYSVPGSSCTCVNGTYTCTTESSVATVQASLVGKWRGTVTPPSFAQPYQVSLWIYPDGTYWGESVSSSDPTFYYGNDGPHPWRKISVLSTSSTMGSWADVGVFTSFNIGALSAMVVTPTKLTFTYNASWHNCGQPFYFNLTREGAAP
ncbi:MAG: hypothetical protein H0T42_23325 [Deltaproteobacteria bacterium]|nr:hypothetical protein [Deltaproteobacteria bacterium]